MDDDRSEALQALDAQAAILRQRMEVLRGELEVAERELAAINAQRYEQPLAPDRSAAPIFPPPPPPPPGSRPLFTGSASGARSPSAAINEEWREWHPTTLRTWLLVIGVGLLAVAGLAFVTVTWPTLNDQQRAGVLGVATVIALAMTRALRTRLPATAEALCVLTLVMLLVDWAALRRAGVAGQVHTAAWWASGQALVALAGEGLRRWGLRGPLVLSPALLMGAGLAAILAMTTEPWGLGLGLAVLAAAGLAASAAVGAPEHALARHTFVSLAALAWSGGLAAALSDIPAQQLDVDEGRRTALALWRPASAVAAAALAPITARLALREIRDHVGRSDQVVMLAAGILCAALALLVGDDHDPTTVGLVLGGVGIALVGIGHLGRVDALRGLAAAGVLAVLVQAGVALIDGSQVTTAPFSTARESFDGSYGLPLREVIESDTVISGSNMSLPPQDARRPLLGLLPAVAMALLLVRRHDARREAADAAYDVPEVDLRAHIPGLCGFLVLAAAATATATIDRASVGAAVLASCVATTLAAAAGIRLRRRSLLAAAVVAALPAAGWATVDATWAWVVLAYLGVVAGAVALGRGTGVDRALAASAASCLAVSATWAGLAPSWDSESAALRLVLVVAWCALALVGTFRRDAPDAVGFEVTGLAGAILWALSTLGAGWIGATSMVACAATTAAAAMLVGRRAQRALAPLLAAGAAAAWLAVADVTTAEAYSTVLALGLLGSRAWANRGLASLSSRRAYGWPLLVGLGFPTLNAIGDGEVLRPVLVAIAAVVLVALGVRSRLRAPLEAGAVSFAVLAIDAVAPYATQLPRWVALGAAGSVVLWLAATVERRMARVRELRETLDSFG